MGRIDNPAASTFGKRMYRHLVKPMAHANLMAGDHDLNLLADQPPGDGVGVAVYLHGAIVAHPPLEDPATLERWSIRDRFEPRCLITAKANQRHFASCAVYAGIGDLALPSYQVSL